MRIPPAEFLIDEHLVRALLDVQCPQFADRPLAHFGEGFDNALWQLDTDLLVRLPRRSLAAPLAANEQRWLPRISPVLPLPIPVPVVLGVPGCGYPWHWSVVPLLGGVSAARCAPISHSTAAHELGAFLSALHAPAPRDAPHNPWRAVPLAARDGDLRERANQLDVGDVAGLLDVWSRALAATPPSAPRTWIHGDLHPGNVLLECGEISGIIDFGDLTAGDPATDLASAWLLFDLPLVADVFTAYGVEDDQLVARARGWAVFLSVMLATIEDASDGLREAGVACVKRLRDEERTRRWA